MVRGSWTAQPDLQRLGAAGMGGIGILSLAVGLIPLRPLSAAWQDFPTETLERWPAAAGMIGGLTATLIALALCPFGEVLTAAVALGASIMVATVLVLLPRRIPNGA